MMKKHATLILSLAFLMNLHSCTTPPSSSPVSWSESSFYKIEDEDEKNSIFNYPLEYELFVPGNDIISYNVLWTGYDMDNKSGPEIPESNRFYTYLTDYEENKDSYYLVYLRKQELTSFSSWYEDYKKQSGLDESNYHFSDDTDVIDGKYLLYAQKKQIKDSLILKTSNPLDSFYQDGNYQLAACHQEKTLTIEKNVSLNVSLNKKTSLFRRFEIFYDEKEKKLSGYSFTNPEKTNIDIIDSLFSYQGKRLEAYPRGFEEMNYCFCPFIGLENSGYITTKRVELTKDGILLPRYEKAAKESIDFLNENTDFSNTENVYRGFKSLFLSAYIKDSDISDSTYQYALFDDKKIEDIIHQVSIS